MTTHTAPGTSDRPSQENLAVGTTHAGFTVTSIEPVEELSGTAYVLRHDASGARVVWLACADTNRSFAIAFKTPPSDDTGVFHILEHSVLCGSDRYPVKEPFVNLIRTSMQTFLNALTFPDKTMYPISSTNVTDFENLMDVYLDAVLHPAIYHKPRIFEQEGWHYELEDLDGPLTYNGVVFNEMKGALSDPDERMALALNRALFPDSPYRFESGGHPRAIPTLTYEQFLETHARHYNLANSYTVFYGDLDIDRELERLAEHFAGASDRGAGTPNELPLQAPVEAGLSRIEMQTTPENALVGLAYVIGVGTDRERILATDILLDALAGSNEAPLKRIVLDADLADDFLVAMPDSVLQPQIVFELKGAHEGVAERFRTLIEDACRTFVEQGIERERLEASLAQAEFLLREGDNGSYSDGVIYSMRVLSSWLYDDEQPLNSLHYEEALAHMKEGLANGYFEQLLDQIVCHSNHNAEVELVPVEEGDAAEEMAELAAIKASMNEDELRAIQQEVLALREMQERPDSPEDLAKLPKLSLDDIGEAPAETPLRQVDAPLPCLAHELETRRIAYTYYYFDLCRLTFDELPYAGILCRLLGKLGTASHGAEELDIVIERELGSLDFFIETQGDDDDPSVAIPRLIVSASSLSSKIASLATLPPEIWGTTNFDDHDRIYSILQQWRIALEQSFTNGGHLHALMRVSSYFAKPSIVSDALRGTDFYRFLKDLLAHWDERAEDLSAKLAELAAKIFTSDEVVVSFTGSAEDRDTFWELGSTLGLTSRPEAAKHRLVVPEPVVKNEAFIIPSNVCYVGMGQGRPTSDAGEIGNWQVAMRAISYDYLWNEVRVKGGAYGCGFRRTTSHLPQFYTYRDPGIDGSVKRINATGSWLHQWDPDKDELDGYIVSVVAAHDQPTKPRQLARRQDNLWLARRPEDWNEQIRKQILSTTSEKLHEMAKALDDFADQHALCVFGGREIIEASEADFTVIDLLG